MVQPKKVSEFTFLIAILIRSALLCKSYKSMIQDRVEVSTPINSWKRLLEGIHLYDMNVDPYTGDLFHESPIILVVVRFLLHYFGQNEEIINTIYVLADVLVARILYAATFAYVSSLRKEEGRKLKKGDYLKISKNLVLTDSDVENIPAYVAYAYLFNPYIILNCAGLTSTNFVNLALAGIFYSLVKKKKLICVLLLSFVTLQSFYLFILIVPVCLQFYNAQSGKRSVCSVLALFALCFLSLLEVCYWISGSWKFIDSTFGFVMNVGDLTPNIGLFWYFFTEMFDHFRALFISALQINATVLYLFPLALHLRDEPVFLSFILVALTAVFKSYPCIGDVGFYFSLLPIWKHLFFFMQQNFMTICFLIVSTVLGPTVWHLWIYSGSANANFYFGVTLAFATAQIFLITDLLFAHKKRTFALTCGLPEDSSGNTLVLD